jgi:hypothetical protein
MSAPMGSRDPDKRLNAEQVVGDDVRVDDSVYLTILGGTFLFVRAVIDASVVPA